MEDRWFGNEFQIPGATDDNSFVVVFVHSTLKCIERPNGNMRFD